MTLAIVALMATAAMPLAQLVAKREKEVELRAALRDIRTALDAYKAASDTGHIHKELGASGYPPDLKSLYAGVEDTASPNKTMLYFMRRVPRADKRYVQSIPVDPFTKAADTWTLVQSDDPDHPGIKDVHSGAAEVAANGTPFATW